MPLLMAIGVVAMGVWCWVLWDLFSRPKREYKAWLIQHFKERKDEALRHPR